MRRLRSLNLWAVLLLIGLAVGLMLGWKWLRGNEEYRWQSYGIQGMNQRLVIVVLLCAALGVACYFLIVWAGREPAAPVSWLIIGLLFVTAVLIQLAMLLIDHPDPLATLFYRTVSTRNLGAFYVDATSTTEFADRLRRYVELMPGFQSMSPRTHPPGIQVLFWGAGQVLSLFPPLADRASSVMRTYLCNDPAASPIFFYPNQMLAAAGLQVAMPVWGALTVVPFYGLARRLFDFRTAVAGIVLLLLAPSMIFFGAHWAHLYTLLAMSALFLAHLGLERRRWWPLFLAGLIVSLASFLSFSNIAVAAMLLVYMVVYYALSLASSTRTAGSYLRMRWRKIVSQFAAFLLGAAVIWLLYYLLFGVSFVALYREGLSTHAEITGYRTYTTWLGYNLFDFFLFLGIPALVAYLAMIKRQVSRGTGALRFARNTLPFWSFTLTLLAINFSGVTRAEVARLWMFMVPLAILAVLPVAGSWKRGQVAVMLAVLIAQVLFMGYYVRTIGPTNYPFFEPRPVRTAVPASVTPTYAEFGQDEVLSLLAYDLQPATANPGDNLAVTMFWQADQPLHQAYTVFVHLVEQETGELRAQHDSMPRNNMLPTTCWKPLEVVEDRHDLALDAALAPGAYLLRVGVYRLDLLQAGDPDHRLPVLSSAGMGTIFDVATIQVEGP